MLNRFVLIGFLFLWSCQTVTDNKKPERLLSENEMVVVLTEMAKIKAIKDRKNEQFKASGIVIEDYFCDKFDIDEVTLDENIAYYLYDPEKLEKIYRQVEEVITLEAKTVDSIASIQKVEKEWCTKEENLRKKSLDSILKSESKQVKKRK